MGNDDKERGYRTEIGVDGFPTDPRHPFNRSDEGLETARVRFIRRNLRRFKIGWRDGVPKALADASRFCATNNIPPPAWLADGIDQLLQNDLPKKVGRGGYAEDMKDFARWDLVVTLREHLKLNGEWRSWEDCYARVAEYLAQHGDNVSDETVKKAYARVKKRMKKQPGRYHL